MIFDSTQNAASNFFNDAKNAILRDTAHAFGENLMLNWQDRIPDYDAAAAGQMLTAAKSYYENRFVGGDENSPRFIYSQTTFLSDSENPVNDEKGRGKIDCSTYMHLVLRGIDYDHSPYGTHSLGVPVPTSPDYAWADDSLRCSQTLTNSAMTGKSGKLARTAADIAKYYAAAGRIFPYNDETASYVRPGDVVFFRNRGSSADRFSHIHHIGMVSEKSGYYYNVTTREKVVVLSKMISGRVDREIAFIARPFYDAKRITPEVNSYNYLNTAAWTMRNSITDDASKVTAVPDLDNGKIWTNTLDAIENKAKDSSTFDLISSTSPLYLPAGRYKLEGAPVGPGPRCSELDHLYWGLRLTYLTTPTEGKSYIGKGYVDSTHSKLEEKSVSCWNPGNTSQRIIDRGHGATFVLTSGEWFTLDIYLARKPNGTDDYQNTASGQDVWQPKLTLLA